MPKAKTHKGTAKRIKVSKTGKLLARSVGQDHFNARDTGKVTKNKRRDQTLGPGNQKIKQLIPHN